MQKPPPPKIIPRGRSPACFYGERLFCFPISFQRKKSQRAPRAYQSVRSTAYLMSPKPGSSAMREPNEAHRRRKEAVPIPGTPQIVRFRSLGSRSERDPLAPPAPPAMESSATGCRSALRRPSHSGLPKKGTPTPNGRWRYLSVGWASICRSFATTKGVSIFFQLLASVPPATT